MDTRPTTTIGRMEAETRWKLSVLDRLLALGVGMERALSLACIPADWCEWTEADEAMASAALLGVTL